MGQVAEVECQQQLLKLALYIEHSSFLRLFFYIDAAIIHARAYALRAHKFRG